jgi:hypothetical protein
MHETLLPNYRQFLSQVTGRTSLVVIAKAQARFLYGLPEGGIVRTEILLKQMRRHPLKFSCYEEKVYDIKYELGGTYLSTSTKQGWICPLLSGISTWEMRTYPFPKGIFHSLKRRIQVLVPTFYEYNLVHDQLATCKAHSNLSATMIIGFEYSSANEMTRKQANNDWQSHITTKKNQEAEHTVIGRNNRRRSLSFISCRRPVSATPRLKSKIMSYLLVSPTSRASLYR